MSEDKVAKPGVKPANRVAIGIAFGNSNSSIAYTVDEKAEVIANEDGGVYSQLEFQRGARGVSFADRVTRTDRQIPTVLSYADGDEYYGAQAKAFLIRNPSNTVAFFREFLGKELVGTATQTFLLDVLTRALRFKSIDPTYCHASAHPHETAGTVTFSVQETGADAGTSSPSVTEIASRFLRRLVISATDYLGRQVTSAVISVPTNYNDRQREALIQAARKADLEVLQLVYEPVAAVLAYDARSETQALAQDKIVVVADLGGTRSDVAIVASRGGMYTVLATAHDYEFAGARLDQVLMDHFAKEFIKKHGADPRSNAKSLAKLRQESEAAKKALSLGNNAQFSVESLTDGIDFSCTINRTRYEMLARKIFEGFNRLVEGVIKKAELDVLDVDEVIMCGGTSHTPRIANNFRALFPESTKVLAPATSPAAINPSELHARGAALQASLIQEYEASDIEQSTHPCVTTVKHVSNAIGVVAVGPNGEDTFAPILHAETAVPARRIVHVPAPLGGGDVLVRVVEGGTHIKVTKPSPNPAKTESNSGKEGSGVAEVDDDDDADPDSEEEEEEKREKVWKIGKPLAELAVRGVKKGGKVEVTISVAGDLTVTVAAREVGSKGGVRGKLASP